MSILSFRRTDRSASPRTRSQLLSGHSIEVMPRTAAKVEDFRALLAPGTRVYIAHIDGTPIDEMVATARRLTDEGFRAMPHFPARSIPDAATLSRWTARYRDEANVSEGLILAGGLAEARGDFASSMDLLETGIFDRAGFTRLHVAGHPEGNRDIDPDDTGAILSDALRWKQAFRDRTGAEMAIVTQFCFEAAPAIAWARLLREGGIDMPIHLGLAGPAKLQTLLKFAIACGVGPSLKVLQKRALDVTRLVTPYTPDEMLDDLEAARAAHPAFPIDGLHLFPLGGIAASADWAQTRTGNERLRAAT